MMKEYQDIKHLSIAQEIILDSFTIDQAYFFPGTNFQYDYLAVFTGTLTLPFGQAKFKLESYNQVIFELYNDYPGGSALPKANHGLVLSLGIYGSAFAESDEIGQTGDTYFFVLRCVISQITL